MNPFTETVESVALTSALRNALDAGVWPACTRNPERWFAEGVDRGQAARMCVGCPILTECAAAAESLSERWGVWAGVNRQLQPRGSGVTIVRAAGVIA